jgi:hypothetical protein
MRICSIGQLLRLASAVVAEELPPVRLSSAKSRGHAPQRPFRGSEWGIFGFSKHNKIQQAIRHSTTVQPGVFQEVKI